MKRLYILTAALLCGSALSGGAQQTAIVDGVSVSDLKIERNGDIMNVGMTISLSQLNVGSNRAVLLTPRLVNGTDSVDLSQMGIYGRQRYYYYVRNGKSLLTGKDGGMSWKASERPDSVEYSDLIPYQDWMDGATLSLHRDEYGCCGKLLAGQTGQLGGYAEPVVEEEYLPDLVYVRPKAERVKSRSLEGSAYIDFPVNKTEIFPDYRRNTAELGRIRATIDSVRGDCDVTITSVWLKGYASPESPYAHNKKLAIGRTESLKAYIQQLYKFDPGVIATDHEPEDWAGLRRYVEQSDELQHKDDILALIDSDREPDNKEWKIKKTYPEDYRLLLAKCYPALRHTDYRIAYTIRSYSDTQEIKDIMGTQPQKLSLNEFYIVAENCEPGTAEFTEVFETAVRMYPADETANLNAANAAMRRGDNAAAEGYLVRAGNSPEAMYARGVLAVRMKDYEAARRYLTGARDAGMEQATGVLEELDRRGY